MILDYQENINEYGDNVVRLYGFDKAEAAFFRDAIRKSIINEKGILNLADLDFLRAINFNLTFRISDTDEGVFTADNLTFYCDLTIAGYENMIKLIEPFCLKEAKGYAFLYDVDSLTDIIFSAQIQLVSWKKIL